MRVMTHFLLWNLGFAHPETQTTAAERECLSRYARDRMRLVEIGVWHGVTTSRLRAAMASDGVLFAVDPYPAGRLKFSAQSFIAHREVEGVANGTLRWVRSTGIQAARDHVASGSPPVDFVFIDGDHSFDGVRGDWEAWSSLIIPGGIIALHDSCPSATRGLDAASMLYTRDVVLHDARFEMVEVVDTLTVLVRKSSSTASL